MMKPTRSIDGVNRFVLTRNGRFVNAVRVSHWEVDKSGTMLWSVFSASGNRSWVAFNHPVAGT